MSGNYPVPLHIPPEQSISDEIKRLIVRLFVGVFDLITDKISGDPSVPSKH